MKKPVIEFKDFSFKYRAQAEPTLNNINLTIYEGEKVLILGPSGSGKSTLSNCINGLVPFLHEGEITGSLKIKDQETRDLSIAELSDMVGTVLQDPDSQFIGLTVGEDIAFKLENDAVNQEEMKKKVEIASQIVGINTRLESSPQRLSGGQKQRVSLAGVMVNDVDILLFDEPLASLDPATGKKAIELIDDIQKNNMDKTIVIIEHRLEDVLHCELDRVILIYDGKILADTTPNELLASDMLATSGIREPLYITALKYADCPIDAKANLQDINLLNLDDTKEKLAKWCDGVKINNDNNENKSILEFQNINFSYNDKNTVLNDVSFKINKGEMVSIVGRNGAGKSTISKLICGFYKPSSGTILFGGQDIKTKSIKERADKIGMIMQNPNQMISKTMIFDEVAFGLKVRGVSADEIKTRVYETLKICGLYEFRNWPISALSYGQKKRVTIASILVLNPEVIILDEPTAGQDFKNYTEIMEFLKEINKKGVTIVMITHDMHLMLEYTNRAIVLADGKKIADDTSANIITNQDIIKKANLKETSLYTLAVRANMDNPIEFVEKFINYDRGIR